MKQKKLLLKDCLASPFFYLGLFFLTKAILLFMTDFIDWDESVYLNMAKWFASFGAKGFFEELRPIILPLLLTPFHWIFGNSMLWVYLSRLLILLSATLLLYWTYFLLVKYTRKKVFGIIGIILLALTPIFFIYSSFLLTSLLSGMFGITALVLLYFSPKKKIPQKFFLAGLLLGISFLTRFPSGLFFGSVLLYEAFLFLKERFSLNQGKRIVVISFGFFVPVISFLTFNYLRYRAYTKNALDALLRPFLLAATAQHNPFYQHPFWFYATSLLKENIFFLFGYAIILFALFSFFLPKQKREQWLQFPRHMSILFLTFLLFFLYYSSIPNRQLRFLLPVLPLLTILSVYAMYRFLLLKKKPLMKSLFALLLTFFILQNAFALFTIYTTHDPFYLKPKINPAFQEEIKTFYQSNNLQGTYVVTDPIPTVFLDEPIMPLYYSYDQLSKLLQQPTVKHFLYNPHGVFCFENCTQEQEQFFHYLLSNWNLVGIFNNSYDTYYFFTKDFSLPSLNKERLQHHVVLSTQPLAKPMVIAILDSFPTVTETGAIWQEQRYDTFLKLFGNNSVVWTMIPYDLVRMQPEAKQKVKEAYHANVQIVQLGYDFTNNHGNPASEFLGLSKESIREKVLQGKHVLEHFFPTSVDSFMPPYALADKTLEEVLAEEGYRYYLTIPGDSLAITKLQRFNEEIFTIDDWQTMQPKSFSALKREIDALQFKPALLISFYYFAPYDQQELLILYEYLNNISSGFFTLHDLASWQELLQQISFKQEGNELFLTVPDHPFAKYLTLTFTINGTYSLYTNAQAINIHNQNTKPITICFDEKCLTLQAKETKTLILGS